MKLEDQVCSLDLAKKLKELGVKQDSLFYWTGNSNSFDSKFSIVFETGKWFDGDNYSAFTVSELLELLPCSIDIFSFFIIKDNPYYYVYYQEEFPDLYDAPKRLCIISDKNLSNACSKLLIYLIENGVVKNEMP